jgi:hypothetical protein
MFADIDARNFIATIIFTLGDFFTVSSNFDGAVKIYALASATEEAQSGCSSPKPNYTLPNEGYATSNGNQSFVSKMAEASMF